MTLHAKPPIPQNHPVRRLFRDLTDRALTQTRLPDRDLLIYLSDLLVEFIDIERLYVLRDENGERIEYLVDLLEQARKAPRRDQKDCYRHIGDYSLFILGMFPENLSKGRRAIPRSYYADAGKQCYLVASELERGPDETVVFRKLADKYDGCVNSLTWVREYTADPFYQYMLRQFGL